MSGLSNLHSSSLILSLNRSWHNVLFNKCRTYQSSL